MNVKIVGAGLAIVGGLAVAGVGAGVAAGHPLDAPNATWKLDRPHWDKWDGEGGEGRDWDGWRGEPRWGGPGYGPCAWVPPAVSQWVPPAVC